ncbi:MAG: hypothetical protein IPJ34_28375 [Myxococcales bacterium]|nr:hypothetical protein [Myxococcales bacterium]
MVVLREDDDTASIRASMLGEILACTRGPDAHAWALEAAASFPSRAVTSAIPATLATTTVCPGGAPRWGECAR